MNPPPLNILLARLWHHLGQSRQRHFVLLLGLMLLSAIAEIISLGAVLPFIGILAAPEMVFEHPFIVKLTQAWGITLANQLLLPLTILFVTAALVAGALRLLLAWASTRLTFASGAELSLEIYRRTLYQPYRVHVARSSSEMISGITNKVGNTVLGVMLPVITLISSSVLLVAIMFALIAIDPVIATVATFGFGGSYLVITWLSRRRLHRNSKRIAHEQTQVVKALQEGLGGIRDVLLDGTQSLYCEIYRQADRPLRLTVGDNVFVGQCPRFVMEALGMVLIAGLAYGLSHQAGGIAASLPMLAVLAVGAQRLLPALQRGYASWASIAGNHASLADTIKFLDQPLPAELLEPAPSPLSFDEAIRFDAVRFRYASEGPWVLDDFSLAVPKGTRIGVVGTTGSGKSTMLDLLMGLLIPTEGQILVDGQVLSGSSIRAWQRSIAHVPQSIYLAETTVAENIAFGVRRDCIDMERVRQAAHQAQIADFVETQPDGYDAFVGERGVRLSGGQRQRIGIARALYKRASVLVLDEATSALDNATEQSVMNAIEGLGRDLTILIIAHRLTTVRHCDSIVEVANGKVVAEGNYRQLLERSRSFRHMVGAAGRAQ